MDFKQEFEEGLKRYKKLNISWTTATILLVAAYLAIPISFYLALGLFVIGGLNLGATGVRCAYVIARDA